MPLPATTSRIPVGRELAIYLPSLTSHSPHKISLLKASRLNLHIVSLGRPELACGFANLASVSELFYEVESN